MFEQVVTHEYPILLREATSFIVNLVVESKRLR